MIQDRIVRNTGIEGLDFILDVPQGREPRIMQVADVQIMRFSGIRRIGVRYQQVTGAFFPEGKEEEKDEDLRAWRYIEEGIARGNPDLIVFTGDNIYGETDDDGSLLSDFCQRMDSYCIPWAIVWGNHDNESEKGVRWQVQTVEASRYGMIRQNNTDLAGGKGGNSNYTVGIRQGGVIRNLLYFLDTNGCRVQKENYGESMLSSNPDLGIIRQQGNPDATQLAWMRASYASITKTIGTSLPTVWFMHIPPQQAYWAFKKMYPDSYNLPPFEPDQNGDQGSSVEGLNGFGFAAEGMDEVMEALRCNGMFLGHLHKNSASVACDGVRYTFGLKTGTFDYFDETGKMLGTLLIRFAAQGEDFAVDYQYTALPLAPGRGAGN